MQLASGGQVRVISSVQIHCDALHAVDCIQLFLLRTVYCIQNLVWNLQLALEPVDYQEPRVQILCDYVQDTIQTILIR